MTALLVEAQAQAQAHAAEGWGLLTGKAGIGEEISEAHFAGFCGLRSGDERDGC